MESLTKILKVDPDLISDQLEPNCILDRSSIYDVINKNLSVHFTEFVDGDHYNLDLRDFRSFVFDIYLSLGNFLCCFAGAFYDLIADVVDLKDGDLI